MSEHWLISKRISGNLRQAQFSGCIVISPASDVALARHPLHARRAVLHDLEFSTLRSHEVGFAAAVAHARLRLSRLELIGGSGRTSAGRRYARGLHVSVWASAARAFVSPSISPTAFEQARGGALGAGGGRVGFAGGGLF